MIAFSSLSQTDTSKICFPRYVAVGIQKDLIRLDYCDSISAVKDTMIVNRNEKIAFKDSTINSNNIQISLYKNNESNYKGQLKIKDDEIKVYKKEIKKEKRITIITSIGAVILVIIALLI